MAQPKLLLMQLRTLFQRPFEAWEEGKEQITLANASSNPPPKGQDNYRPLTHSFIQHLLGTY